MNAPALRFKDDLGGEWRSSPLSNLASIYDGTHLTPDYKKFGIPFYSVEHVTANDFSITKFISEDVFNKENKKVRLEQGDLLMTKIGDIGTVRYIDWDVRASFYVSLALIKQSENINSRFLSHYIATQIFQRELHQRIIHVAFPKKINLGEIGNCLVKYPSPDEQTKIATFLSAIDGKTNHLTQKHELLEQYKKGVMQKIFSQEMRFKDDQGGSFPDWEVKNLSDISVITTGKSNREDSSLVGEYAFFDRSQDIRTSDIYLFDGEAVIVPGEGQEFVPKYFKGKFDLHQRTYAIMNFSKELVGVYLFYFTSQNKQHFLKYAVGSTVKSLRMPAFESMKVNLPCLSEQTKIADFLSVIDKKITNTKLQLEATKQYKQGLLQQMFV